MAGFDVVYGIDIWPPACITHYQNGLGRTGSHDLLEFDVDKVLALKEELEGPDHVAIDIVIGSPPCTEFSMAKKAGHGDQEKGLLLVRKHLLFVALFKPKYWLMENVPRLEEALDKECGGRQEDGWRISYKKLGIDDKDCLRCGLEEGGSLHIPQGQVLVASDFGTCENRKRFIAGDFPLETLKGLVIKDPDCVSLRRLRGRLDVSLNEAGSIGWVEDPNYPGHFVKRKYLRDHDYDTTVHPMYWEEMRHLKCRNIQYGRMKLPEDETKPARTIMATSNSSSRESLLFETNARVEYQGRIRKVYRQPTVREIACIQGFPIDFQLVADRMDERYKLIGNAVPCQLSFALARSIAESIEDICDAHKGQDGVIGLGSIKVGHSHITIERALNDRTFFARAKETLRRLRKGGNRPIIERRTKFIWRGEMVGLPIAERPCKMVPEAMDIGQMHSVFKAKPAKNLRRKLLSSKLEKSSCVVIFENGVEIDGKVKGGIEWKVCIQKGIGAEYHKVFLDEVSVAAIIDAIGRADLFYDQVTPRQLMLGKLIQEVNSGIPRLNDRWIEFPGLSGEVDCTMRSIIEGRSALPGVSYLQRTFTEALKNTNAIGGLDFFDGLDAITLLVANESDNKEQLGSYVKIGLLEDNGNNRYPRRLDGRILPTIDNEEIPLVTLMTGLMSVHALRLMYDKDFAKENESGIVECIEVPEYYRSLCTADDILVKWAKRSLSG